MKIERLLSGPADGPLSAGWTLLLAVWFGGVFGLVEMAPLGIAQNLRGVPLRMSVHLVWMTPVANLLLFAGVGLALAGGGLVWVKLGSRRLILGIFAGLGAAALLLLIEALHDAAIVILAAGIGVQAARMSKGRVTTLLLRIVPITTPVVLLIIGALTFWSFARERGAERDQLAALPAARAGAPNILLLILDTVRAQSLSLHGRTRTTSPNLDSIAQHGVVFDLAVAPAPWTAPSHASMFTGQWPHVLGVDWFTPMDDRFPTLAETLTDEGYATAGFVGNLLYGSRETGLARGFARYDDYPVNLGQIILSSSIGRAFAYNDRFRRLVRHHELLNRKTAEEVNADFLRWLDVPDRGGSPWFAFVNYYDAHEPYFPADSLLKGQSWNAFSHGGGILTGGNAWYDEKARFTLEDARIHAAAYEDAVMRADEAMGSLLEELDRRDILDNTLVIITSDHGEQLGEHGLFAHNNSLFMTVLHVPMVILWPGRVPAGERVIRAVSLRDLPASILDLIEAPVHLPGSPYAGSWTAGDSAAPSPVVSFLTQTPYFQPYTPLGQGQEMHSIVELPWHYIHNGNGTDEFYDLNSDPNELRNLAGAAVADTALVRLRSIVFEMMTGQLPPPGLPIRPSQPRWNSR